MYPTPYVRVWVCLVPQECKQSEDLPPGGQETNETVGARLIRGHTWPSVLLMTI